ncbi:cache domain-containing protein [Crassaminicella profunda]|uniref:cache domain-containing protein n=1 Tax=Crassaminicella profunda TaxID=1286698 RepID=UPI001CA73390|nr:cache domain-containing protein [Crassaminicella profunda]QZY55197.1 hypothetical protein K7H06_19695 [Crassaminicella profunda]
MHKGHEKYILWFILLFVVAASLIGTFYIDYSRILKKQYVESFDDSIVQLDDSVSEFFSTFENALQMFSKNEMVQKVSDDPNKYYLQTMQLFKSFQQSYAATAFAYFAPNKIILGNKKLITWPDTSEALANTEWTATKRPWYMGAIAAKGRIAWTKPYLDATTKKPIVTISRIVRDESDELKGVMAIDFFLDELSNKIENFKAFKQGHAFVIAQDGKEYYFISRDMKNRRFDKIIEKAWRGNLLDKKSGNFTVNENNVDYYITYKINKPTGWKIIGIIEEEKIYKPAKDMIKKIFTSSLMIMGMGIMSIVYIFKQMRKSIRDLSHSLNDYENMYDMDESLSNQFNILLEDDEHLIDESSDYMGALFESQSELEKLMDRMNDQFKNPRVVNLKELEHIINQLNKFRKKFEKSSLKVEEIQKENIENHMGLLLDKIKDLKKDYMDEEQVKIIYKIEKKLMMRDIDM